MISVLYNKKGIRINQIWFSKESFCEDSNFKNCDIAIVHGLNNIEDLKYSKLSKQRTCINDLKNFSDEIINKTFRYEIRRNQQKDNCEVKFFTAKDFDSDKNLLTLFGNLYEEMYKSKGMAVKFNYPLVRKYLNLNCLFFSAIYYEGVPIIFHCYIKDGDSCRFLYSASNFRNGSVDKNLIGRANKRLHYEDFRYCIKNNYTNYDWGGAVKW